MKIKKMLIRKVAMSTFESAFFLMSLSGHNDDKNVIGLFFGNYRLQFCSLSMLV